MGGGEKEVDEMLDKVTKKCLDQRLVWLAANDVTCTKKLALLYDGAPGREYPVPSVPDLTNFPSADVLPFLGPQREFLPAHLRAVVDTMTPEQVLRVRHKNAFDIG